MLADVCVCVCVCVMPKGGGDAILKRKTCMGLRAACFEKEGGVPADEPPHLTVGVCDAQVNNHSTIL